MTRSSPWAIDPRAVAGGLWTSSGALLASLVADAHPTPKALVAAIAGVVVMLLTWSRFPPWNGRPSSLKWIPCIAALQTALVVTLWWNLSG